MTATTRDGKGFRGARSTPLRGDGATGPIVKPTGPPAKRQDVASGICPPPRPAYSSRGTVPARPDRQRDHAPGRPGPLAAPPRRGGHLQDEPVPGRQVVTQGDRERRGAGRGSAKLPAVER